MAKSTLLASTAVALLMCTVPATAQMQPKEEKGGPAQTQGEQSQPREQGTSQRKGDAQDADQGGKRSSGTAEKDGPKGKASKGTAEKSGEPRDKAEKSEPREKSTKGTAQKGNEPKEKATQTDKAAPSDKGTKGAADRETRSKDKAAEPKEKSSSGKRVQISEEKRTNVHQSILKDRSVNRVTKVNFSINIGTRVPRSVRLAALPVTVIEIVPEYRSYRYFVVDDQICIVEPDTYEIVEVIRVSDRTAGGGSTTARLVLTEEEKMTILREVDMRSESTLGLGALTRGSDVPRGVNVRAFPKSVVERVPKLRDYRFFAADNQVAIVDPNRNQVELVIEGRR